MGGTSEEQQDLDHFEDASPLLFGQINMFNILLLDRRLRHRDTSNKFMIAREFNIRYIVSVRKKVKSNRNNNIA